MLACRTAGRACASVIDMISCLPASHFIAWMGRRGGWGPPAPPLLHCAEAMFADRDRGVDFSASGPPPPRNPPTFRTQQDQPARQGPEATSGRQRESGLPPHPTSRASVHVACAIKSVLIKVHLDSWTG